MRMSVVLVLAGVVAMLLAGCSGGKAPADDVVILGGQTVTETKTELPTGGKGLGHIAGFVVTPSIQVITGATVRLVSLDLNDITDRTGGFEFIDLKPGSYLLKINATGYERAESYVDVKADKFTRVKVILKPIPPPDPVVDVLSYNGYAWWTSPGILYLYSGNYFDLPLGENVTGVVLEAVMDGSSVGGNGAFRVSVEKRQCCGSVFSATRPNPFWAEVNPAALIDPEYRLYVAPTSDLVPELSKQYQVFASIFYGQTVPPGYSVVAGTT